MDKLQTFQNFLTTTSVHVPAGKFIFNLLLAALLSVLLEKMYILYGKSISNRKYFGRNFMMLTMVTVLIISVVKSSLALSLGLVGALSIVRFRAAIKEPEELTYLFFSIGIGLGLGADQVVVTVIAFILISAILYLKKRFVKEGFHDQNLHLTITSHAPDKIGLDHIVKLLIEHCETVDLKRFDETSETIEVSFMVEFSSIEKLNEIKLMIQNLNKTASICFLETKGLY